MEAGRPEVRPERVTDTYAIVVWRQVVIWVVDGQTPVEELERLRRVVRGWADEHGRGVALTVIHPTRSGMTSEERASVARMIDETKAGRMASATVILATGVLGALHRSLLTGLSLLVPPPHPVKFTSDLDHAIAWLRPYVEHLSGPVRESDIRAIAEDLHAAVLAEKRAAEAGAR